MDNKHDSEAFNKNSNKPMGARSYSRHGLNQLKARVMVRGLSAIDKRTAAAQALLAWRKELFTDLGGEDACSAQQKALVEVATRTRLYVESLDAWIMSQKTLVNHKRKAVLPVVLQRQTLADALARYMTQLGLERREKPVKSLPEYLADLAAEEANAEKTEKNDTPTDEANS